MKHAKEFWLKTMDDGRFGGVYENVDLASSTGYPGPCTIKLLELDDIVHLHRRLFVAEARVEALESALNEYRALYEKI